MSAVERELVLRLASVLWRLHRATGIETALFESVTEDSRKHKRQLSHENLGGAADLAERKRLFLGAVQESDAADGNELSSDSKPDIADCFLRLADLPTGALDRLCRYEHMLWRQARQIVFTLESLRRRRRQPIRSAFPFSFRRREPGAVSEEFR
jgi:predicted secreted protein